jgi:type I site-specific restriction endonuclease
VAYNEEETRHWLINPMLDRKGYNTPQRLKLETPAPVEPSGPKGRRRKGAGRTDYLLCVQVGDMPKPLPVAVLEAKKENEDPLKGMQQAKGYADCARFDVKYVFATNGHLYGEFDKPTSLQNGPYPLRGLSAACRPDCPLRPGHRASTWPGPRPACCSRPTARRGRKPAITRMPPSAPPSRRSS